MDVNARDAHGNSLLVLACQQGNKRLAKLLLRRHANINAQVGRRHGQMMDGGMVMLTVTVTAPGQNVNGNTALHYLVAYKHTALAEYLRAKGADDTLTNAAGLTCYEGLSQSQVDAI